MIDFKNYLNNLQKTCLRLLTTLQSYYIFVVEKRRKTFLGHKKTRENYEEIGLGQDSATILQVSI